MMLQVCIDDILLVVDNFEQVRKLKNAFKDKSILKFTYEIERKKELPFLDTLITRTDNNVTTTIYTKTTIVPENARTSAAYAPTVIRSQ